MYGWNVPEGGGQIFIARALRGAAFSRATFKGGSIFGARKFPTKSSPPRPPINYDLSLITLITLITSKYHFSIHHQWWTCLPQMNGPSQVDVHLQLVDMSINTGQINAKRWIFTSLVFAYCDLKHSPQNAVLFSAIPHEPFWLMRLIPIDIVTLIIFRTTVWNWHELHNDPFT